MLWWDESFKLSCSKVVIKVLKFVKVLEKGGNQLRRACLRLR